MDGASQCAGGDDFGCPCSRLDCLCLEAYTAVAKLEKCFADINVEAKKLDLQSEELAVEMAW